MYLNLAFQKETFPTDRRILLISDGQLQQLEQRVAARPPRAIAERRRQRPNGLEGQIPQVIEGAILAVKVPLDIRRRS